MILCDACFGVIWDVEFDGGTHFLFDPRNDQTYKCIKHVYISHVINIRSDFYIHNFSFIKCLSYPVLSQGSKDVNYIDCNNKKCQKMPFKR